MGSFSQGQIQSIIYMYKVKRVSANKIAKEFGVSITPILGILRRNNIEIRKSVLTEDEKKEIIRRYQAGESSYKLCSEYGVVKNTILTLLNKNDVKMRKAGSPMKVTEEDAPSIVKRYMSGESAVSIAQSYNCGVGPVLRILHKKGVKVNKFIPMNYEWVREINREVRLDENFFSEIDNEKKAYWLGFIAADGHIKKNTLVLKLKREDTDHLAKLNQNLKASYGIFDSETEIDFGKGIKTYQQSTIYVNSLKICSDLNKHLGLLGLKKDESKTYKLKFPYWLPEHLYVHFIRGLLDGDGSIQEYGDKYDFKVIFYGTKSICEGIKKIIKKSCDVSDIKLLNKQGHLYEVKWGGRKQTLKVLGWLYDGATIYLTRKYLQYKKIQEVEYKKVCDLLKFTNGNTIRNKRIELGYSRAKLASLVGCSISYINAIENEYRTNIDNDIANNLLKVLKIDKGS
ncbi:helix-turn-helix domain-containing protein [Mangrovibacillus sp. Mu-81]|uniref:helix-turn-helix domain-containing protein n=1 Tax=Bacillaceae TaxID=186817 RepID=UPI0024944051|nr:helix-turn-helix domain-containing protein [Rossellomorea aquimaris]